MRDWRTLTDSKLCHVGLRGNHSDISIPTCCPLKIYNHETTTHHRLLSHRLAPAGTGGTSCLLFKEKNRGEHHACLFSTLSSCSGSAHCIPGQFSMGMMYAGSHLCRRKPSLRWQGQVWSELRKSSSVWIENIACMARLRRLCRAHGTEKEHELTLGEKT